MVGIALLTALVAYVAFLVISLICEMTTDGAVMRSMVGAVATFVVVFFPTWAWAYKSAPTFNYSTIYGMIAICLIVLTIVGILTGATGESFGTGWAFGALLIVWLLVGGWQALFNPWGQGDANHLAHLVKVTRVAPGAYPETDTEHISLMPEEAAAFKADQALTQARGKNSSISTLFEVGVGTKQSIQHHLYWVFRLDLGGTRAANRVHYIVPGYIVVDAEDPEAAPQLKLGYKMFYTPGARAQHSLKRLVRKSYPSYVIEDVTLEINDDWQPYFTASLNKPAYTFGPSLPKSMIVIDPQKGKITNYKLGHAPDWVDRVYSSATAKRMMNWWGEWGAGKRDAPWKSNFPWSKEGAGNRYKVSGEPNLVYTKDKGGSHPEWQMLMTSYRKDNAAFYVALFDARQARVRLYRVSNLQTENAVVAAFESTAANTKKFAAAEPALHKIYGRLTWVVGYINENDGEAAQNQSLQALGLLAADSAQGNNVQFRADKAQALLAYQQWLAGDQGDRTPGVDSKKRTATGTVEHFSSAVVSGNTNFYLILKEDPTRVYRGQVDNATTELPFVTVGDAVRITYYDYGEDVTNITAFDDVELQVGTKTGG